MDIMNEFFNASSIICIELFSITEARYKDLFYSFSFVEA
jgi:hypothetical protein